LHRIKFLIITKYFPPQVAGGLRRIEALYRIFSSNPRLCLKVITAISPDQRIYPNVIYVKQFLFKDKTGAESLIFSQTKSKFKFVDKALIGWLPHVFLKIITKKFDFVFATTPVFTNVLIGYLYTVLKGAKSKLIVEYRDFYSFDPEAEDSLAKKIMRKIEVHILKKCFLIIVTTQSMKRILKDYVDDDKIHLIRNFIGKADMDAVDSITPIKYSRDLFHIGYVGTLNTGRDPRKLLPLLNHKIETRPVCLHFVGTHKTEEDFIQKTCEEMRLNFKYVMFHGIVSRIESLSFMKSFDAVALLINSNARIDQGYGIPGKLYDYGYVKNSIISDYETYSNLFSEFDLITIENMGGYIRYRLPSLPALDDSINFFINNAIINS
jgi:hypothetical protein